MSTFPDTAQLRRWIYHLIIAIAFAIACGRIVSVQRVYEPAFYPNAAKWPKARPDSNAMFGSNDRARWATMRALVHDGTYVIGKREPDVVWQSAVALFASANGIEAAAVAQAGYDVRTDVANPRVHNGIIFKDKEKEHGWATIDRVMNPDTLEFYSSKPPLLATLLAGIYWIFLHVFGVSLIDSPTTIVRAMLLLVNALPFAGYLWLLTRVAERWGKTDWGKLYVVAAGAFATIVNPFLITLNNHTVGTFAVMLAWWSVLCVWDAVCRRETPAWQHFVSAGFFAAFAVTTEMPALSFAAAAFVLLLWWCPRQALLLFLPAALVPAAAFFATNYVAMGQLRPAQSQFGGPWYEYEGSHWSKPPKGYFKTGIDWTRYKKVPETHAEYAFHVLIGHHGLFSLTPIWLLAVAAMLAACWRWRELWRQALFRDGGGFPWFVQPLGLALTVIVVGFYLVRTDNYGGFTNGLRWLMWLTPIWLTCLLPMADRLATSKPGRWLGVTLLAISVFSVSYQLWSPWRHPWIFDLMIELGWPGY
jgi:hypothetical protein